MLPERVRNLAEARRLWRERADHFASFLLRGDPLADDLVDELSRLSARRGKRLLDKALSEGIEAVPSPPAALTRFFAEIDKVPMWVDFERLDRGGATFLRSGPFTVMAMMCGSLPLAYAPPAGNKPLIFSGRLVKMAPLRLAETGRFFLATCQPGGLRRFSEGFRTTARVRLMHAVRRLLLGSELWQLDAWGVPINQADMAGTNLRPPDLGDFQLTRVQKFRPSPGVSWWCENTVTGEAAGASLWNHPLRSIRDQFIDQT